MFMPGERRPTPVARDAAALAARSRAETALSRARMRLDGLYALFETDDQRDAALVSTLLAEDLDAAAAALVPHDSATMAMAEVRAMLGPLPGTAALADFAGRAEARLDTLEGVLATRLAGNWCTAADRFATRAAFRARAVLVVVVMVVAAAILLGDSVAKKRRAFIAAVTLEHQRTAAGETLSELAALAARAKKITGKPLFAITGFNCTRCGCEGRDLRTVPDGDVCVRHWRQSLARIGQAAGASEKELARFVRDPWGAPFLLNENEGESPDFPCQPDTVATAGQNGLDGDGDDITTAVAPGLCPK